MADVLRSSDSFSASSGASQHADPAMDPTPKPRRKRSSNGTGGSEPKVGKFKPLGANGRPIVLSGFAYSIDVASLQQYASTAEAAAVVKKRADKLQACAPMSEREVINRFLKRVQPSAGGGDGLCTVSYTRSEVG